MLVEVFGYAWDHNERVVSPSLQPELWFRPVRASVVHGLMTHREVKATFEPSTGVFSVLLERDVDYVPVMRWLTDASQANESVQNRARGYCEWPAFTAYASGDIDEQPRQGRTDLWWVSLTPPPAGFKGLWLVTDPTITPDHLSASIGDIREEF